MDSAPVNEDYLDVDKEIPGQSFCCISFVSPEKIYKKREVFYTKKFIENLGIADIDNLDKKFDDFMNIQEETLQREFQESIGGSTSIRGLKVRGVYNTHEEAKVRAQLLQRMDRSHNVFVGQVGYWLPWDPNPEGVHESEYMESELNTLMKQYKQNEVQRDMFYAEQVKAYKQNTSTTEHPNVTDDEKKDNVSKNHHVTEDL
tara:strand:- start:269 stop:874 length:606 start_codon:yes stop_codon:yes gene_type:complete